MQEHYLKLETHVNTGRFNAPLIKSYSFRLMGDSSTFNPLVELNGDENRMVEEIVTRIIRLYPF